MRKLQIGDVIHCKNIDDFNTLQKLCEQSGVTIEFGQMEIQAYDEDTCYRVDYDLCANGAKTLFYADVEFYLLMGLEIMNLDSFK